MGPGRGMVPDDLYELTGAADPRLSPDGATCAYVVWRIDRESNEYRSAIWLAPSDGSGPPRRFTSGSRRDVLPRWSPDGSHLAFASNRDGAETAQLHVIPAGGGEARMVVETKEAVTDVRWSPDGSRLAYVPRVRAEDYEETDEKKRRPRRFTRLRYRLDNVGWTGDRPQHVFVVPADGSVEPRRLTEGDFEEADPAWSPDGSLIAFCSLREDDWDLRMVQDVYVAAADGSGEPRRLTTSDGACEAPSWGPDGRRIAVRYRPGEFDSPRHAQIAVVPAAGGPPRVLTTSLDRTCNVYPGLREPIWDGDRIVFISEDSGNTPLYRVPADGSAQPELIEGGERMVSGYDHVAGRLALTASTPTSLDELFVDGRRLTEVGSAFAGARDLASPERFTATAPDGTEVERG